MAALPVEPPRATATGLASVAFLERRSAVQIVGAQGRLVPRGSTPFSVADDPCGNNERLEREQMPPPRPSVDSRGAKGHGFNAIPSPVARHLGSCYRMRAHFL